MKLSFEFAMSRVLPLCPVSANFRFWLFQHSSFPLVTSHSSGNFPIESTEVGNGIRYFWTHRQFWLLGWSRNFTYNRRLRITKFSISSLRYEVQSKSYDPSSWSHVLSQFVLNPKWCMHFEHLMLSLCVAWVFLMWILNSRLLVSLYHSIITVQIEM